MGSGGARDAAAARPCSPAQCGWMSIPPPLTAATEPAPRPAAPDDAGTRSRSPPALAGAPGAETGGRGARARGASPRRRSCRRALGSPRPARSPPAARSRRPPATLTGARAGAEAVTDAALAGPSRPCPAPRGGRSPPRGFPTPCSAGTAARHRSPSPPSRPLSSAASQSSHTPPQPSLSLSLLLLSLPTLASARRANAGGSVPQPGRSPALPRPPGAERRPQGVETPNPGA